MALPLCGCILLRRNVKPISTLICLRTYHGYLVLILILLSLILALLERYEHTLNMPIIQGLSFTSCSVSESNTEEAQSFGFSFKRNHEILNLVKKF